MLHPLRERWAPQGGEKNTRTPVLCENRKKKLTNIVSLVGLGNEVGKATHLIHRDRVPMLSQFKSWLRIAFFGEGGVTQPHRKQPKRASSPLNIWRSAPCRP